MRDSDNLPAGVTTSMIPGNSRREIAVERAMEEAEHEVECVADGLRFVAADLAGNRCVDELTRAITRGVETLEGLTDRLGDARNILDRVLDD